MTLFLNSLAWVGAVVIGWQVPSQWGILWILIGLAIAITSIAVSPQKLISKFGLTLGIALILFGRTSIIPNPIRDAKLLNTRTVTVTGIAQIPEQTNKTVKVKLNAVKIVNGPSQQSINSSILLEAPLFSPIRYGDKLKVEGKIFLANQEKDSGYQQYLLHHLIVGTMIYPNWSLITSHQGNYFIEESWNIEQGIEHRLNYLLPQDEVGLIVGIVLGVPRSLSENLNQALKVTGTTHIVVASGYNLSIIIALCSSFGKWLGKSKTILLATVFIVCYILISGANPSILRAASMAGLAGLAMAYGRQRYALNLLIISGLIMLFVNPLWVFDTSFQLSFAATLGILLFQERINKDVSWLPGWLVESVSTTTSAQILVWPILVATFGSLSLISIFTNALVLWTVPFIMAGGAVLIVASFVWQPLAFLLGLALHPFLTYIKWVIEICSQVPYASIHLPLGWVWITAYYFLSGIYLIRSAHYEKMA